MKPATPIGSGSSKGDPPAQFVDPKAAQPKGPRAMPPAPPTGAAEEPPETTTRKKKATRKPTSKKKSAKKKATRKPAAKAKKSNDVDTSTLSADEAKKRIAEIYRLEKIVEGKAILHEVAKGGAKAAKDALACAEDDLEKEIRDQRHGPGPLFPVE